MASRAQPAKQAQNVRRSLADSFWVPPWNSATRFGGIAGHLSQPPGSSLKIYVERMRNYRWRALTRSDASVVISVRQGT